MRQKLYTLQLEIPARRWEKNVDGGGTSHPDGVKRAKVDLWIDLDALLLHLGPRAMKSVGKQARLAGGDIMAKVDGKVTHHPER